MSVLVLDDHRMVAQSIAGVLSEVAGLESVAFCTSVEEACGCIRSNPPDLLVLDVELGNGSHREPALLLKQLNPAGRVLFVTALGSAFQPCSALQPICIGVVDKGSAWDELLNAVQHWRGSQRGLGCTAQLVAIERLSPREQRVLLELGRGLLNKEIAAALALSPSTVESYRKSIAAKLGISGAELVRLAALYRCLRWEPQQPPAGSGTAPPPAGSGTAPPPPAQPSGPG